MTRAQVIVLNIRACDLTVTNDQGIIICCSRNRAALTLRCFLDMFLHTAQQTRGTSTSGFIKGELGRAKGCQCCPAGHRQDRVGTRPSPDWNAFRADLHNVAVVFMPYFQTRRRHGTGDESVKF